MSKAVIPTMRRMAHRWGMVIFWWGKQLWIVLLEFIAKEKQLEFFIHINEFIQILG